MKSNALFYSLKVWLTSVALAPLIYLFIDSCLQRDNYGILTGNINRKFETYVAFLILGGLFSIVTWVLFFLVTAVILIFYKPNDQVKCIIAAIGMLLTIGTFAVFVPDAFHLHDGLFCFVVANCVCIAGGALFYDLKLRGNK